MAQSVEKYKDINQVLSGMRQQIIDSVQWCYDRIPVCENPAELFRVLKSNVRFKDDPGGDELLQASGTLFDNNYHGVSGWGDCDCFTITAIAAMIAQGWSYLYIVLAGNSRVAPVHVYAAIDWEGERKVFDLTEPFFNQERHYSLKCDLPIKFYT